MYRVLQADKIFGEVSVSGAKNAALPIIVAAGLSDQEILLKNVPVELNDVGILVRLMNEAGYNIETNIAEKTLSYRKRSGSLKSSVSRDADKIRYSLLFLSLLLQKTGEVHLPTPGGCKIGDRMYDIHVDSLNAMGGNIIEEDGYFNGKLASSAFTGTDLLFHIATTSGTENVIIAAVLAEGKTVIKNANTRPEVIDLIKFLNLLGADIKFKTRCIEITGVKELGAGEYNIMGGRDEGLTYAILAGMGRGEVKINNFSLEHVKTDVELLRSIGLEIYEWNNDVYVSAKNKELKPFSMATAPYPGINSDMQPLFAALAATIEGETIITDMRFNDRFQYVTELRKFGVSVENYSNCAIIDGQRNLKGADVVATDLRGGAAMILLGCIAEGETRISNEYQIDRGYIQIAEKLNNLGCNLTKE